MSGLWRILALRDDYPSGTCWAWVDSAGRACGRPDTADEPHLCVRHSAVARRRFDAQVESDAAKRARRDRLAVARLPKLREQLAQVDAEIARRDPPPPTTDPAAYGGVGSTTATGYRRRLLTASNITRLAELHTVRKSLATELAYAEHVERTQQP